MSEVAPDSWQDALTRRLRTLVRLSPLHRLEAAKAHRGEHLGGIDTRALALRALDLAIERMGLGGGMTHDELTEELLPLIARMSPQLDPPDRLAVAVAVLHGLLNERERRREFQEPYVAFEGPLVARRTIDFRLLRETETADGAIVLRATTEAINIYAGMLEYPVEDAQIAEESVLKAQLSRGQIADAVRTAQRARVRSIEYEQKIQGILDTVRRDIKQVDWIRDVLALLDAARLHLADRQEHERELLALIDARLDLAIGELAAQLAALRDAVDECYRRHMQLHRRLIPANQEYLREQDRQVFRPRLAAALPDLEGAVLRPALALPTGQLAALTDALLARFLPPRPPPLLRLTNLIDRLLAPAAASTTPPPISNKLSSRTSTSTAATSPAKISSPSTTSSPSSKPATSRSASPRGSPSCAAAATPSAPSTTSSSACSPPTAAITTPSPIASRSPPSPKPWTIPTSSATTSTCAPTPSRSPR
jgi:hypothetical protein